MTIDEAIKHEEVVAKEKQERADSNILIDRSGTKFLYDGEEYRKCRKGAEEHKQLAEWLKELKQLKEQRVGEWRRMSDLSEDEDSRYQCSRCGNVVHFTSKENLYTFSRWCGRCGSNNDRR